MIFKFHVIDKYLCIKVIIIIYNKAIIPYFDEKSEMKWFL